MWQITLHIKYDSSPCKCDRSPSKSCATALAASTAGAPGSYKCTGYTRHAVVMDTAVIIGYGHTTAYNTYSCCGVPITSGIGGGAR
jgi:hypothetical protein